MTPFDPDQIKKGDFRTLARAISLVENESPGFESLLKSLPAGNIPVIGITGPPGAGKSSLVDALAGEWVGAGKKLGILCVDPSSPFSRGALLGDRIRMSQWYTHPAVYIRSLASRGNLGGINEKMVEITEVMKSAGFDYIIVETVGVGQTELEIAGLADCTVLVLAPESGDEIQAMKAGIMEIADLFVVNKGDRPEADHFVRYLKEGLQHALPAKRNTPVLKTVAIQNTGIKEVSLAITEKLKTGWKNDDRFRLMARRAFQIIRDRRMNDVSLDSLEEEVQKLYAGNQFNLYKLVEKYL